jgi:hypothetical protein
MQKKGYSSCGTFLQIFMVMGICLRGVAAPNDSDKVELEAWPESFSTEAHLGEWFDHRQTFPVESEIETKIVILKDRLSRDIQLSSSTLLFMLKKRLASQELWSRWHLTVLEMIAWMEPFYRVLELRQHVFCPILMQMVEMTEPPQCAMEMDTIRVHMLSILRDSAQDVRVKRKLMAWFCGFYGFYGSKMTTASLRERYPSPKAHDSKHHPKNRKIRRRSFSRVYEDALLASEMQDSSPDPDSNSNPCSPSCSPPSSAFASPSASVKSSAESTPEPSILKSPVLQFPTALKDVVTELKLFL